MGLGLCICTKNKRKAEHKPIRKPRWLLPFGSDQINETYVLCRPSVEDIAKFEKRCKVKGIEEKDNAFGKARLKHRKRKNPETSPGFFAKDRKETINRTDPRESPVQSSQYPRTAFPTADGSVQPEGALTLSPNQHQ